MKLTNMFMTGATAARPVSDSGSHWYYADGRPCYELSNKSTGGTRAPTLADARKLNLLPSVTNILKVLHKQALVDWLIEQACLAVLTTPQREGEGLDEFVHRVLHTERVQDQESMRARELGTDIHNGLEALFKGERIEDELRPWIEPAYLHICNLTEWASIEVEKILVETRLGFGGKADFIGCSLDETTLIDFKSTKKLPEKASWQEHRLQLSAYSYCCVGQRKTANLYISTTDCGKFAFFDNPDWETDFNSGFAPILQYWQWMTGYVPLQEEICKP